MKKLYTRGLMLSPVLVILFMLVRIAFLITPYFQPQALTRI